MRPILKEIESKCFYLDEIIDIKCISKDEKSGSPTQALLCSNNETLKLIDLQTGNTKQFSGHKEIILCIDVYQNLILSGSKDNQIRLWRLDSTSNSLTCLASFLGHTENIASVFFAPKKGNYFVSAS